MLNQFKMLKSNINAAQMYIFISTIVEVTQCNVKDNARMTNMQNSSP